MQLEKKKEADMFSWFSKNKTHDNVDPELTIEELTALELPVQFSANGRTYVIKNVVPDREGKETYEVVLEVNGSTPITIISFHTSYLNEAFEHV